MTNFVHGDGLALLTFLPEATVDLIYMDPPFFTQKNHGEFDDRWSSLEEYVAFISQYAQAACDLLRPTGNFILHVDPRSAHYLKVAIDQIFGYQNFGNEVVWHYSSGGAGKKTLAKKHDTLLWWGKTPERTFNVLREPYATQGTEGRPGFHPEGRMLTDVWDISIISTTGKERTGYPTQKPLRLLERVVEVWSNPGDLVVDPMCGSGTTGMAALSLGREFLLNDKNLEAVRISQERCGGQVRP